MDYEYVGSGTIHISNDDTLYEVVIDRKVLIVTPYIRPSLMSSVTPESVYAYHSSRIKMIEENFIPPSINQFNHFGNDSRSNKWLKAI